jgi:hypothetical protein
LMIQVSGLVFTKQPTSFLLSLAHDGFITKRVNSDVSLGN